MFLCYTAFVVPHGSPTYHLELPRGEQLSLPEPMEQFAMVEDLADGYHKRVRVHLGKYVAVAMLDTGSFRNCVDEDILKMLEAKQQKGELGKKAVISPRKQCTPTRVDGAANGYIGVNTTPRLSLLPSPSCLAAHIYVPSVYTDALLVILCIDTL